MSFLPLLKNPAVEGKSGAAYQLGNGRTVRTLQWRLTERNDVSNELYNHRSGSDPDEYHKMITDTLNESTVKQLHTNT